MTFFQKLDRLIQTSTGIEDLCDDRDRLLSRDLDYLDLVAIIMAIERDFDVEITDDEICVTEFLSLTYSQFNEMMFGIVELGK